MSDEFAETRVAAFTRSSPSIESSMQAISLASACSIKLSSVLAALSLLSVCGETGSVEAKPDDEGEVSHISAHWYGQAGASDSFLRERKRTITLPTDASSGRLLLWAAAPESTSTRSSQISGSKGVQSVTVPAGYLLLLLLLEPNHRVFEHPDYLNQVSPDGIEGLKINFTSLDDREDGMCDRTLAHVDHLTGLKSIAKCRKLTELRLAANPKIDDTALKALSPLKSLIGLDLRETNVTAAGLSALRGCKLRFVFLTDRGNVGGDTRKVRPVLPFNLNKKSVSLSISLSFLGAILISTLPAKADEQSFNAGCKFLKDGDAHSAIAKFDAVLKASPKNSMAYCKRGESYAFIQRSASALKDYNKAIELDSKNALAYYDRAHQFETDNKNAQALADFSQAIKINPLYTQALGDRGMLFKRMGRKKEAIEDFSQVTSVDFGARWAHVQRALIYEEMGDFDKALADLDAVVKMDPKNFDSYEQRGQIYAKKGDLKKAISDFTQVIILNPNYAGGYVYRAMALEKLEGKASPQAKADWTMAKKHGH